MVPTGNSPGRLSGKVIIEQLIRNMEMGQLEMGYSVLLPCIFSIYLHPEDHARLFSVQDLLREDAKRALTARMSEMNRHPGLLRFRRGAKPRKQFKIASKDWVIELFADSEGAVPVGDVEIHSELNETPQPGFQGVKTTLIGREPAVGHITGKRDPTRKAAERVFAEIRYQDDSGPQLYLVTQSEICVGRGDDDLSVDLPLYTGDEVSREHLRLRRDAARGQFLILDNSTNGTWLNGRRLARGVEEPVPDRAEIGVAEVLTLSFEAKR